MKVLLAKRPRIPHRRPPPISTTTISCSTTSTRSTRAAGRPAAPPPRYGSPPTPTLLLCIKRTTILRHSELGFIRLEFGAAGRPLGIPGICTTPLRDASTPESRPHSRRTRSGATYVRLLCFGALICSLRFFILCIFRVQ